MELFSVRATTEHDWRDVRSLRLEMLADTPLAFGEHLDAAQKHGEVIWRLRGARGTSPLSCSFAAVTQSGRWVGTMGGVIENGAPLLVGVYVSPDYRGAAGVADALLVEVEDWSRQRNASLYLHVHSENPRARAFYAARGFIETGVTIPYVLDRTQTEVEMVKQLG
jgi:GNAT superfamily N-acetyltransferase